MSVTVLFVAANPNSASRLGLDEEIRQIEDKLRGAEHQKEIAIKAAWAARPNDLLRALNEFSPDVLHFSGHGDPDGRLIFVDNQGRPKPVSGQALAVTLRSAGENVQLVMLNACYSYKQASALVSVVPCAVGMNTAVGDEAAIVFAASFYQGIGFGASIRRAFDQAIAALLLEDIPEDDTPELMHRIDIDPADLFLVGGSRGARTDPAGLELIDMALVDSDRYCMEEKDGMVRIALRRKGH